MKDTLTIRYGDGCKMVLKLQEFYPRTKTWLNQFERLILRYCPDREEVINDLLDYLTETAIPGLPEAARQLDSKIRDAHLEVLKPQYGSWARESAQYVERQLKSRQKRWPKYCADFDMNREVIESWKRV